MAFSIVTNNNISAAVADFTGSTKLLTTDDSHKTIYAGVVDDSRNIVSDIDSTKFSYFLDPASASSWVTVEFKNINSAKTAIEIWGNQVENSTGSTRTCKLYLMYDGAASGEYITIRQVDSNVTETPSDMEYMCLIYGTGLQDAYAFATKVENVTDIQNMSQYAEAMVGVEEGNTENAYYSLPLFSDGSMTVNTEGGDLKEVRSGTTIYIYVWQQGIIKYAGSDQVGPKTKATAKRLYPSNV